MNFRLLPAGGATTEQLTPMKRKPLRSPPERGLAKLGDILPQLLAKYGVHRRRDVEGINDAWKVTVGPPFDAVSQVIGLSRGTLEISVPHPAFVQELSFRQMELVRAMQTALPNEKIKQIKFFVQT